MQSAVDARRYFLALEFPRSMAQILLRLLLWQAEYHVNREYAPGGCAAATPEAHSSLPAYPRLRIPDEPVPNFGDRWLRQ